ncbi:hypothetical protein AB0F38_14795, partial [Streptomyces sp. NPDC025273]
MSIQVSPEVNAMIFILTGERLMDADEDLAYESRRPYSGLGRKLDRLSSLIDKSIHDIGESMPDDLAKSYGRAMGMLVDDGGKNYLRDFAEQLDKIAEGRRKTSMDIMESKWQVIAEIIRLLIEIAIYLAMSFFTGGATASQIMMAKMRSRFFILTTLSHLLQRLHLAPSLTEAFAEAFTTFAVRLAMMNFAPDGRRPDGIDWNDVLKSAAFGAAAGFLTSVFDSFARSIVRSFDNNFLKNAPDLDFKNNPNLKNNPSLDLTNGPNPKPNPTPNPDRDGPLGNRPDPTPYGNGNGPNVSNNLPVTFRNNPLSFRNNTELWRNSQILRNNADRPGALAGHYGLKGTADFLAAGSGEALAEILIKGAYDGDWSTNWSTFVGAGISSQVEATLSDTAVNSAAELRHAIDKLRHQPPTVSGGHSDADSASRTGDGPDRTDGPSRTDTTGGDGPALTSLPPVTTQTTGQGDVVGTPSSSPHVAGNPPPYTGQNPTPYSPGALPVTAVENDLWQQVHQGPAEVREQALRDLAALRGAQPPGSAEIGVRDSLHGNLSQLPEVRVVPTGGSPAAQVDTDEVRRALDGFGTPVTVDAPITVGATPGTAGTSGTASGAGTAGTSGTASGAGTAGTSGTANGPATAGTSGTSVDSPVTTTGDPAARPAEGDADPLVDHGPDARSEDAADGQGAAPVSPGSLAVEAPANSTVTSQGSNVQGSLQNDIQDSPESDVQGSRESDLQGSPEGAAEQNDRTAAVPGQGNVAPVATGGPGTSATPGAGGGARPGGVPAAGGATAPAGTSPQGTRTSDGAPLADGSPTAADDSARTTAAPEAVDPRGSDLTPESGESVSAPAVDAAAGPAVDTAKAPDLDTTTAPPKVSTIGSFADTGDAREVSGTGDVHSDATRPGNSGATQAPPLTIVVSQVPPPGEGSPEAAELLDGAGTDRAVVLGPALAPEGAGRPVRAAVELTRDGPGAPVQARTLTGTTADGTEETAFPGADVLLPLADALGPMPRPATQSTVTTDSAPVVTSTATPPPTVPEKAAPVHGDGTAPDPTAATAPAELGTLSRPWSETATDLHLESGEGERGSDGTGGQAPGPGTGPGTGNGATPPSPTPATPESSPATPPVALPPPPARIVVRPVDGAVSGGGNGSRRPTSEPAVVTLDGLTVPLSQVRRLIPDATEQPQPGRAVRTLTISQSVAEDGTPHDKGRRALLGQDTFRGVRTVTTPASPSESPASSPRLRTDSVTGIEAAPPTRRTVFTGPSAPLPGAGTEQGADYFVGHGTPRTVTLGTDDLARPSVKVSGVQLGEVLKAWATDGDQDRPLVLYSCETGRQPEIAGLPVAQHVANRTGRPVYAPTTDVGTARDQNGDLRPVLAEGADGPGRWRLFTPEPRGGDLDRAARDAGLHTGPGPADAFARARTLQQIRTLRDALGPDAEQRSENRELLAGLAYVDGLRWRDADSAARYGDGRMTPDLLRRMVTDWHTVTGATPRGPAAGPATGLSAGPTPEQYTAFLGAAAALRAVAGPDTTLDELLPPPPPELSPTTLISQEDVRGLSYTESARVAWSLSGEPLPLSALGLGPEDTAELARRLHDPAPAADVHEEQQTPLPLNTTEVNSYTARHTYGIPEKNFKGFRDLARDKNLVIDVRPTNPLAPKWLESGALAKPQEIKAKTVNEVDVRLGADEGNIGLVG